MPIRYSTRWYFFVISKNGPTESTSALSLYVRPLRKYTVIANYQHIRYLYFGKFCSLHLFNNVLQQGVSGFYRYFLQSYLDILICSS